MQADPMDNLPDISPDEKFCFACGPEAPCFNRCCAQLNLPLTPYDVVRLARNCQLDSASFLNGFTGRRLEPETGFFLFHLRMIESPDAPCPFVSPAGCMVYDDRPGACRSYPLGRGARLSREGISERYFMVREEHCCGFGSGPPRTAAEWFQDQGLDRYNHFNDRYMRLMSLVAASGRQLEQRVSGMATLSLWDIHRFRQFISQFDIFNQVIVEPQRQRLILEDSLAGDEACLEFGLDWLELVIFGRAENLARRP